MDHRSMPAGLAGLPTAPPALALPAMTPAAAEPIVEMRRRYLTHRAVSARYVAAETVTEAEGEEAEAAMEAASDLEGTAEAEAVTTLPGALAALEWGRDEFALTYCHGKKEPEPADLWTLAMLDKGIGVVRQLVERGAA